MLEINTNKSVNVLLFYRVCDRIFSIEYGDGGRYLFQFVFVKDSFDSLAFRIWACFNHRSGKIIYPDCCQPSSATSGEQPVTPCLRQCG